MGRVHAGCLAAFACVLAGLALVAVTVGLGLFGWSAGIVCAGVSTFLLSHALGASRALGPADRVTLARLVLSCVIAALVADSFTGSVPVPLLVVLSATALVLDAVDGRVARRTRTASALGARFDMEVDALLILVLSGYVAADIGWWVLAIGAAHYLLAAARKAFPWLCGSLSPRYWCKVVAAIQGVVLTVVVADVLPEPVETGALVVALVLLVESFGREVWELWCLSRGRAPGPEPRPVTLLALGVLWFALVMPNELDRLTLEGLARIPVEGLVVLGLALVLAPWARRTTVIVLGVVMGVLVVSKALDMGFDRILDRPFDPMTDWAYLGPAVHVLGDSIGRPAAIGVAVAAGAAAVAVLLVVPVCLARLVRLTATHRPVRVLAGVALVWGLCALIGLQFEPAARVASAGTVGYTTDTVSRVRADLHDRQVWARAIEEDRFRDAPSHSLLTALRGKDVLLVFVESYGRTAVEDPEIGPPIDALLDEGTRRLQTAGYDARSAFLTSPTFGAGSWLAHAALQSGLWVDSQQRYDQLLEQERLTLTQAFDRAGWRTVFDAPATTEDWPEGAVFYGFDTLYDAWSVGYEGPEFAFATMPDQYVLAEFQKRELAPPHRAPVMAQIELVSSHHPWTPLPRMVDWADVGDGSVFDGMPEEGESREAVFSDPDRVREAYGRSIEYTLSTLVSFLQTYPDDDLVLVVVGDHQPHKYVTGEDPGHDVPVSVIAQDPAVLDGIESWDWQAGLNPGPDAPVLRMDLFRDRFLEAFSGR